MAHVPPNLGVSQLVPCQCEVHAHEYCWSLLVQVPPFWHGLRRSHGLRPEAEQSPWKLWVLTVPARVGAMSCLQRPAWCVPPCSASGRAGACRPSQKAGR